MDSREGVTNQALRILEKMPKNTTKIKTIDKSFFVTSEKNEKKEYEILSEKLNLFYGGVLQN